MSVRKKFYQIFSFIITGAGVQVNASGNFNVLYEKVTGVTMTSSDLTGSSRSTFKKMQIDNNDVFPDGYEISLLQAGQDVAPKDRYENLDERAAQSPVDITILDGSAPGATYPHTINLYFRIENLEKENSK